MRLHTVLLAAFAIASNVGCSSTPTGEPFSKLAEPKGDHALLYLYRPDVYYGKALSFTVLIDGKEKGEIGNGGFMIVPLDAGTHVIGVKGLAYQNVPHEIDVSSGNTTFLRVVTETGIGGLSATLSLEVEDESKAVQDLAGLKREPDRFLDEEI